MNGNPTKAIVIIITVYTKVTNADEFSLYEVGRTNLEFIYRSAIYFVSSLCDKVKYLMRT